MTFDEIAHKIVLDTPFLSVKSPLLLPHDYTALESAIAAALAAAERAAFERAADEIERIGREQPDARDDAFLLGVSFVIRDLR